MIARGALGREHDRVGAVENGVGDVARLGAGGPHRVHHRLQHLRRHDDGTLVDARKAEDLLLDDWHALGREFDAEVAAGDHDCVGRSDDALEVVDGRRRFDLRDDGRGPAPRLADLAHVPDVLRFSHEREGHVVDAERQAEGKVGLVLFGEGGDAHAPRREVHARLIAHRSGLHDLADDAPRLDATHLEADPSVVDQDGVARLHVLGEPFVLDGNGVLFGEHASAFRLDERDLSRGRQHVRAAGEGAGADLRTAQVLERGDGLFAAGGGEPQRVEPARVLFVAAVREVETGYVHSRDDEPLERLPRVAGRADGADNLGTPFEH
jgi:hypothetical protein